MAGPAHGRLVIVGTDAAQEWLLPWWYHNYQQHNLGKEHQVCFADFGMTSVMRAWCDRRGGRIGVPPKLCAGHTTWHRKPLALSAASAEEALWVDADCEVRGDLTEIFEWMKGKDGIGVTLDPYNAACKQPGAIQSGVLYSRYGEPIITAWMRELRETDGKHRGDQEALNVILPYIRERVHIMPDRFQRLRLGMRAVADNDLIRHWTGPAGKLSIMERLLSGMPASVIIQATSHTTPPTTQPPMQDVI